MLLIVVVVLLILAAGLELTGLATGLGMQTLPLLILLAAGLLVGRAVWPERSAQTEDMLHIPREAATDAELDLTFGAGTFALGAGEPGDSLVTGSLRGTARHSVARGGGVARITLRQPLAVFRRRADWALALSPDVTWGRLHLMLGAAQAGLDLHALAVQAAVIEVGGTTLQARLPASGSVLLQVSGGRTTVIIPAGAAVEIESEIRLGDVQVDEARFQPDASGMRWQAAGDGTRPPLRLTLKGGLGAVAVRSE